MEWKLAEAKNKFSEVVTKALHEGPQKITRRNESVIVINEKEYQQLTGQKKTVKEVLMEGPSLEGVNIQRDQSTMRDIDL